jgi:hypothetical protein
MNQYSHQTAPTQFVEANGILWHMPETAELRLGALASLRPRVRVPPAARSTFASITPVNIAAQPRQVRHAFSYAGQQASGMGYWTRDREHIEKSFDDGYVGRSRAPRRGGPDAITV